MSGDPLTWKLELAATEDQGAGRYSTAQYTVEYCTVRFPAVLQPAPRIHGNDLHQSVPICGKLKSKHNCLARDVRSLGTIQYFPVSIHSLLDARATGGQAVRQATAGVGYPPDSLVLHVMDKIFLR